MKIVELHGKKPSNHNWIHAYICEDDGTAVEHWLKFPGSDEWHYVGESWGNLFSDTIKKTWEIRIIGDVIDD